MKRLLNFFRPQPRKLLLIRRLSSRISIEEWRSNADLVTMARKFLNDPDFQIMIDALENAAPHNYIALREMSIDARAMEQSKSEGYQLALNNLFALGSPQVPKVDLEADFSQPEEELPEHA
jgi:hypothetical protein